jgi:hypothetical protein
VACRRFRSGYSGGGRAGISPASLTYQQTLATFPEEKITVKQRLASGRSGREALWRRAAIPTPNLLTLAALSFAKILTRSARQFVHTLDMIPCVV